MRACIVPPCARAGGWRRELLAMGSRFSASVAAEFAALSGATALRGSVDAQSAVSSAMTSSGAPLSSAADVQPPLKIRACTALLFRSLYTSPSHLSEATTNNSSDILSLEYLATLLCAYGAGGPYLPQALLAPWCKEAPIHRMNATDKGTTDTPQTRAWARTMIAGCMDALRHEQLDTEPNDAPQRTSLHTPCGLAYAELCILSLCDGAGDVRKWLARAPRNPIVQSCISKWKREVLVAMACAMRIPNCATQPVPNAADIEAATLLASLFTTGVCDWGTMEEVELPFSAAEPLGPVSYAAAVVMSTCFTCVGQMADAGRIVSKVHHHNNIFRRHTDALPSHTSDRIPAVVYNSLLTSHMRAVMVRWFRDGSCTPPSPPLLRGLGGRDGAVDAMLDVNTVVGLLSDERKQFDAHAAAATSLFALRELHPLLAGDPYVVAWLLTAISSHIVQLSRSTTTVASDIVQSLREMQNVLKHLHVHSIVAACVPSHLPIESLMVAARDDERRVAVGVLLRSLRDALGAALLCAKPLHSHAGCVLPLRPAEAETLSTSIVDSIFCIVDAVLSASGCKESDPTHHRHVTTPKWKKHLPTATKLRTHKMEVLRDELPQGSLCTMSWLFLQHGYLAHGVALLAALLRTDRLDLHFYPLHVLAAARSALRVDGTLLRDAADAQRLKLAFTQRFLLFGEKISSSTPDCPTTAAHHRATPSKELIVVSAVDRLVYPELDTFRQSVSVSCVGAMHFLEHRCSSMSSNGAQSEPRGPKGWKRVSSAVV